MKLKLTPKIDQDEPITSAELQAWRKRIGWSQARAAGHLGFALDTYRSWEQGRRSPQQPIAIRKLMRLARGSVA